MSSQIYKFVQNITLQAHFPRLFKTKIKELIFPYIPGSKLRTLIYEPLFIASSEHQIVSSQHNLLIN